MTDIQKNLEQVNKSLKKGVQLVAVSKTKPNELLQQAYDAGQRVFGENKVQELVSKYESLAKDIQWHFIGHLQTNKVKFIVPFVQLIHAVDSIKLLKQINKEAEKHNKIQEVLLQVHIAQESTKFGFSYEELTTLLESNQLGDYPNIQVRGLMSMATNSSDEALVANEFSRLNDFFQNYKSDSFNILSIGMSNDYHLAMDHGSTMVRVGSTIFGARNYN